MKNPLPVWILNGCCLFAKCKVADEIKCPECGERLHIWGHGSYARYGIGGDRQVQVPRFRCLDRQCPRKTFSILPYPMLRYLRHSLCTLVAVAIRFGEGEQNKSRVAVELKVGRRSFGRLLRKAVAVTDWFDKEVSAARWGPWPPHRPESTWTAFTQAFSHCFYPDTP